jgi:uncharacterized metal-binding protein YceD (DUF177 family)
MENFNLDLKTNYSVVVKFKDNITSTDDKVVFLSSGSHSIDVSHMIYESIILAVPQKKSSSWNRKRIIKIRNSRKIKRI